MKTQYDLSKLDWKLSGWTPDLWKLHRTMEIGAMPDAEIYALPAKIPGSVQYTLREAGIIPDWNVGLNARDCEWVENRHWIYETSIPDEWVGSGKEFRLNCLGLDYCGSVFVNGNLVADFSGSHVPHVFDVTSFLAESGNKLRIAFELPPRWLGQFGFTSKIKEWKTRFHYTWDWVVRLVQVGIWDSIYLEAADDKEIRDFRCVTDADAGKSTGSLKVTGRIPDPAGSNVRVSLSFGDYEIKSVEMPASEFNATGLSLREIPVKLWWPNMMGDHHLYGLSCTLIGSDGSELDKVTRSIGFKQVVWDKCEGAVPEADPWICVVNGKPVFLQGIDWTPILPNFADTTDEDYRKRISTYADLGLNILRVWGGAFLEKEVFYNLCDEYGILVWQEFPMSSSGVDNLPPSDEKAIEDMAKIAQTYIARRQHHVSLTVWCGGNELQKPTVDGSGAGGTPVGFDHPMICRLKKVVEEQDPSRRFLPTSPTGPRFFANQADFGKGLHWCVHGPWKADGDLSASWTEYWNGDDSLFRSETGAPGASSVEIIRKSMGDCKETPMTPDNPFWRRTSPWWIETGQFVVEYGRDPETLEELVAWSQERQKNALCIAVKACKDRFPRCGGIILWMGHDCYPCGANTAIIDFEGNPKPSAIALSEIWRS
ncbi:MAG: glycoside hydrolase family 2 protein [Armatimonadota bacterium]